MSKLSRKAQTGGPAWLFYADVHSFCDGFVVADSANESVRSSDRASCCCWSFKERNKVASSLILSSVFRVIDSIPLFYLS
uniref:hypothetical protein n=1 Tax=Candidatus Fimivicinus sp. TaxID=3056640 RepID=UPI003FEF7FC4